jgi:hypothetical protein
MYRELMMAGCSYTAQIGGRIRAFSAAALRQQSIVLSFNYTKKGEPPPCQIPLPTTLANYCKTLLELAKSHRLGTVGEFQIALALEIYTSLAIITYAFSKMLSKITDKWY